MKAKFINRHLELKTLNQSRAKLIVVFGRRRIGKTTLIEKWGEGKNFSYTQAIEGSEVVQIEQMVSDLKAIIPDGIHPRTWNELLSSLKHGKGRRIIVLDEFPYLVRTNGSLPSLLQKWVDHDQPNEVQLVVLGSSQNMMHSLFLNSTSPLYERADLILKLEPMSYKHFCEACDYDALDMESFLKFSIIGGIPRYWTYMKGLKSVIDLAEQLFFEKSARLEDEPDRLLKDEEIVGQQAKAIFESIGRGAAKPSEIAARMGIPQTALSKPLSILINSNLVSRILPFAETPRNAKKTIYTMDDYALRFWYQVYSPHRSRWNHYERDFKMKLIRDHASKVLEDEYRKLFPEGARYWEGDSMEFDCVRYTPKNVKKIIITEIKLKQLSENLKTSLEKEIREKFLSSKLSKVFQLDHVEVLGGEDILSCLNR